MASLPKDQLERAQAHLEIMRTLVDDLPRKPDRDLEQGELGEATGQLTEAEGQALRAIRVIIQRVYG